MARPRRRAAVWRTLRRLVLETGSLQTKALEELDQIEDLAPEIVRYQNAGYELVSLIARVSPDPESQERARRAITQFRLVEALQLRIIARVHEGTELVDAAQAASRQTISLVTRVLE